MLTPILYYSFFLSSVAMATNVSKEEVLILYHKVLNQCLLFQGMKDQWIELALTCLGAFEESYPKGICILDVGTIINEVGIILSYKSIRERVLLYLSDEMERCKTCEFSIAFSQSELAEYLQLDRSAMARELGRMKRDGLINYERSRFRLLKPDELEYLRIV